MTEKLSVCFIWHMHQPLYKDRLSGTYLMPWVRLHAIKDYLDMPLLLERFPAVKQTFNLVPSLIEQIEDYGSHAAVDRQMLLMLKDCKQYTSDEKLEILTESFHCNLDRQIRKHQPYFALWQKRDQLLKHGTTYAKMLDQFNDQEYADMMTWMNLAWFDPLLVQKYKLVSQLTQQGGNFSLEQRRQLLDVEREVCRITVGEYKRLQDDGRIEITTTPYYHPILPLLIDTNSARLPAPYTTLPGKLYFHQEDAAAQLDKALRLYKDRFGRSARGMWPSEMSVSPAAVNLIAKHGINWIVADEAILCRTKGIELIRDQNGNLNNPEALCQPYSVHIGDQDLTVVFREVVSSNEIGFSYGHRDAEEAATALYMHLKHVQQKLFHWQREGVIVIALDGENCWETYPDDGHLFLSELYERISKDNSLNICTVSDYLQRNPPTAELFNIHAGSWIGADFRIWIGDPAKNHAWDLLNETRNFLVEQLAQHEYPQATIDAAWEEIYAAEGSDWFWWFGEPNSSAHDAMFDEQFRLCLQHVYQLLGQPHPDALNKPVEVRTPSPAPVASSS